MSLQTNRKYDFTQGQIITVDLSFINNESGDSNPTQQLKILENRDFDFIGCSGNYYLTVARFQLQTINIPVFIPEIEVGQPDIDKTKYRIYFKFGSNWSTEYYISFNPQNIPSLLPSAPLLSQDVNNRYYHITNLDFWIENINDQISGAWTTFKGSYPGNYPVGLDNIIAPQLTITPQTGIVSFNAPKAFNDANVEIHFNTELYNLFCTAPFNRQFYNNLNKVLYRLRFPNTIAINPTDIVSCQTASSVKQMHNPIVNLVFSSNVFPVIPDITNVPYLFGSAKGLVNNIGKNDLTNVLTDFVVAVSETNQYSPMVTYEPSGEWRWVDMMANSPLNKLDLTVYWKDKFGNLYPLNIDRGAWGTIKLMFRRKDFGNIDLQLN